MDETRQDDGEIFEAVGFLNHFSDLTDGRQAGKVVYPLDEVLLLALLAVLAGAETFTDIARFGEKKLLLLLRRFRPFKDGTPPQDGWRISQRSMLTVPALFRCLGGS